MQYATDVAPAKASRTTIGVHLGNLRSFWAENTLADICGSACRRYTHTRQQAGCQPSTARRELKTLSAAVNFYFKEQGRVSPIKLTLPPEGSPRLLCFERVEIARMLRACRKRGKGWSHVARFILIGVYTGTRSAAILSLRWQAALVGGHIDIERGVIYRRGSAEKETSKRRPPVRADGRLMAHLRRWRQHDSSSSHYITVIHYAGHAVTRIERSFATIVADAGLGPEYTPHVLRHTACSWLLWQGHTPWQVGKIVGATAHEIEKTYGHSRLEIELRRKA